MYLVDCLLSIHAYCRCTPVVGFSPKMDDRRFQDFSGRSFGDASDAFELNPYSDPAPPPGSGATDQPTEHGFPRPVSGYSFPESYGQAAPLSYPLTEPYAAQRPQHPLGPGEQVIDSDAAWLRRQTLGSAPTGGLKRYATRKVKLVQGSVLSIDYPVPSSIRNSIQRRYREEHVNRGWGSGDEEFVKMRCRLQVCLIRCR